MAGPLFVHPGVRGIARRLYAEVAGLPIMACSAITIRRFSPASDGPMAGFLDVPISDAMGSSR
jgi:hypothetical protein